MKKWLFNPFVYIAGTKALIVGIGIMIITAITSTFGHVHFDGAIDMHFGKEVPAIQYFLEQAINWISLSAFFLLAGLLFSSSSVRIIDIMGTVALARWPTLLAALVGIAIKAPKLDDLDFEDAGQLMSLLTPSFILLSLLCLFFIIWMIALLYNAFVVSCNLKGNKAVVLFVTSLILAEIASQYLLHLIA